MFPKVRGDASDGSYRVFATVAVLQKCLILSVSVLMCVCASVSLSVCLSAHTYLKNNTSKLHHFFHDVDGVVAV